jgi:hypothetical protein
MKRFAVAALMLLMVATPSFAKTHKEMYSVPCTTLWPAVKDTLRNSGKYGIIGIDNTEMTASYNMGGTLAMKRVNSVVLNSTGNGCELQVQTAYSGLVNNDAGDFKKRVDASLEKLKTNPPPPPPGAAPVAAPAAAAAPAKTDDAKKPDDPKN